MEDGIVVKYFSMFSGIGGFELGIERAFSIWNGEATTARPATSEQGMESTTAGKGSNGSKPSNTSAREPGEVLCIGYSEIDKYAISVYERNFRGHTNYGDATRIDPARLPEFDLLVGGFPCQAFSVAGKRKGFDEARGTLFFDIARILRDKAPRHLVLENVKGLLSHDSGRTFQTILGILTDMGYCVEWQVLNSKDFGVPQNRERIYIVGHLGGGCRGQVFPLTRAGESHPEEGRPEGQTARTLRSHQGGIDIDDQLVVQVVKRQRNEFGKAIRREYEAGITNARLKDMRHWQAVDQPHSNTLTGVQIDNLITAASRIRRLTPRECERLQGFPDDWTRYSSEAEVSDTQRYKMCGNAVTVNVVEKIMENMKPCVV